MPETTATIGRAARRHTAHRRALIGLSVLLGASIALVPAFATARPVEPGDTLTDIAQERYGRSDWTIVLAIAGFNDIDDPNLIIVGDEIALPSRRELRRHAQTAPVPAPEPAVALEHVAGTDWDGDGVIEPEPGEEPVEEAVEEPEPADPPEEDSGYDGDDGGAYWPWNELAECESGGDWHINTGNSFYGGIQFSLQSWQAVGGSGYPHENSMSEQIYRGELLQDAQGWNAWPSCARQIGLL